VLSPFVETPWVRTREYDSEQSDDGRAEVRHGRQQSIVGTAR
jgi:hypothetical protein